MNRKQIVMTGAVIGGIAGGFVPDIWGGSAFGTAAILTSTIGGFAGIWLAFRMSA